MKIIINEVKNYLSENEESNLLTKNWEQVKPFIHCKVYSKKENMVRALNEHIPFFTYLDLMVTFYIQITTESVEIPIADNHLYIWGITKQDLLEQVKINTTNNTFLFCPLSDYINTLIGDSAPQIANTIDKKEENQYVITNKPAKYGASAILLPQLFKKLSETLDNCNFYILPCSIHELIIIPTFVYSENDFLFLRNIVLNINTTLVSEEDYLSDSIYYYDYELEIIRIVK